MEPEIQNAEPKSAHPVFKVTTLSKYLAMTLFILMPFVGGYIGYVYAPKKVVEVEKVILPEKDIASSAVVIEDILNLDQTKRWSIFYGTSTIYTGDNQKVEDIPGLKLELVQNVAEAQKGLRSHQFTDALRELWERKYEVIFDADGKPTSDLDVYKFPSGYIQVEMNINFTEWSSNDVVEPGSMKEAFGKPISVSYEIFITDAAPEKGKKTETQSSVIPNIYLLPNNYFFEELLCDYITGVDDFCYRLLKRSESGEKLVVVENLTELFRTSFKTDRLAIGKQYFSEDGSFLYFKSFLPNSSGCCSLLKFNIENLAFEKSLFGINQFGGDKVSASGRYIGRVGADGSVIEVIDITKDQVVASQAVSATETAWASYCGYDGAYGNLEWKSEDRLIYGVYNKSSLEVDKCEGVLVEYRNLVVTNH